MKQFGEEYLLRNCPYEFYKIYDHTNALNLTERPDYDMIKNKFYEIIERKKYLLDDPYDWEEGGRYD